MEKVSRAKIFILLGKDVRRGVEKRTSVEDVRAVNTEKQGGKFLGRN